MLELEAPHAMKRPVALLACLTLLQLGSVTGDGPCQQLNNCNGHGTCTSRTKVCDCLEGWGASTDTPAMPMKPDCSERMCKMGKAWADLATATDTAHALVECSNAGICNRASGLCTCFQGFES